MAETERGKLAEVIAEAEATARDQLSAAWQLHVERVEERLREGWSGHLERVLGERFGELARAAEEAARGAVAEAERAAEQRHVAELESAVRAARALARRELAEALNQDLRRLAQAEDGPGWTSALLDATKEFCEYAAVFSVSPEGARCEGVRAPEEHPARSLLGAEIALGSAAAFAGLVDSRDTVVAARTAGELGAKVVEAFGEEGRAYLFPVQSRQSVVAVLYAQPGGHGLDANGLELVCQLAASALESRVRAKPAAGLVTIEEAPAAAEREVAAESQGAARAEGPVLSREEEELHAKARRFARVQVAEMRLYKSGAVKAGRAERRLYAALRADIDKGRNEYYRQFISATASMADYFHEELVRTLANDDEALLGPEYPGPLV